VCDFAKKSASAFAIFVARETPGLAILPTKQNPYECPRRHGPVVQHIDPTRFLHFGTNKERQK
jgi:hypothetical protein